jgi:hypothetical protein
MLANSENLSFMQESPQSNSPLHGASHRAASALNLKYITICDGKLHSFDFQKSYNSMDENLSRPSQMVNDLYSQFLRTTNNGGPLVVRSVHTSHLKYISICDGKLQSVDFHKSFHFYGRKLVKTVTDGK